MDSPRILACAVFCAGMLGWAAPATAATVVGQAPPLGGTPTAGCDADSFVQATVSSGPSYTVPPGPGVITQWLYSAGPGPASQIALGVFRREGTSSTFTAVNEDLETTQPSK